MIDFIIVDDRLRSKVMDTRLYCGDRPLLSEKEEKKCTQPPGVWHVPPPGSSRPSRRSGDGVEKVERVHRVIDELHIKSPTLVQRGLGAVDDRRHHRDDNVQER
ncbi:hypothetical protein EVAR_101937_1 [Eumeta japonica]|uniref:Uncharacterized protein n=1 Tax=Eumeta variegata TaxID=151549 RepID=A0A4C1TSD0_EUMVA|nr:hypothetical protein EVAR_101937_1 [Eumeta japonica]